MHSNVILYCEKHYRIKKLNRIKKTSSQKKKKKKRTCIQQEFQNTQRNTIMKDFKVNRLKHVYMYVLKFLLP